MENKNNKNEVKEEFRLLQDGRVEHKFTAPEVDYNKENYGVIGKLQNTSVAIIDSKEKAIEVLEFEIKTRGDDVKTLKHQDSLIKVDVDKFGDLPKFQEAVSDIVKACREVTEKFSSTQTPGNFKANVKSLKEINTMKQNAFTELLNIDKQISDYNKKMDIRGRLEIFEGQLVKMKNQLVEVEKL